MTAIVQQIVLRIGAHPRAGVGCVADPERIRPRARAREELDANRYRADHGFVSIGGYERASEVTAVGEVAPQSRDQRGVERLAGMKRDVRIHQPAFEEVTDHLDFAEHEAWTTDEIEFDRRAVRLCVHHHATYLERRIEVAERLRRREQLALQGFVVGVIERRVLQAIRALHQRRNGCFRCERLINRHRHLAHDYRLTRHDLKARLPAGTRREFEFARDARIVKSERLERGSDLRVCLPRLPAHQPFRRIATELAEAEKRLDVGRLRVGHAVERHLSGRRCGEQHTGQQRRNRNRSNHDAQTTRSAVEVRVKRIG